MPPYGACSFFCTRVRRTPPALQVFGARIVGNVAKVVVYACRDSKMMDSMSGRLGLHAFAMRAFDRQQIPRRETLGGVRQRGAEVSRRTGYDAVEQIFPPPDAQAAILGRPGAT
jgi:hypothetical protein